TAAAQQGCQGSRVPQAGAVPCGRPPVPGRHAAAGQPERDPPPFGGAPQAPAQRSVATGRSWAGGGRPRRADCVAVGPAPAPGSRPRAGPPSAAHGAHLVNPAHPLVPTLSAAGLTSVVSPPAPLPGRRDLTRSAACPVAPGAPRNTPGYD